MRNEKDLFVSRAGCAPQGPYSIDDLAEYAREGKLLPTDLVAKKGDESWVAASTVSGIFPKRELNLPDFSPAHKPPLNSSPQRSKSRLLQHRVLLCLAVAGFLMAGFLFLLVISVAAKEAENPMSRYLHSEERGVGVFVGGLAWLCCGMSCLLLISGFAVWAFRRQPDAEDVQ